MHIKEIRLQGFKSYKDETIVGDIVKGLNIIVGRNGSGKSNIFSAIEYTLSPEFHRSQADCPYFQGRAGAATYVEVIFDNEDEKLPIDAKTVVLRRTFNMKKNRLCINGKELLDVDAKKFLRAAGFTNPYYFVKQGKIHDLALASNSARYKIIAEVTGAQDYDQRISECHKTIATVDAKVKEAEGYVNELKKRKDELEDEVTAQKEYLKSDSAKRSIQYLLHQRDLQKIDRRLDELERSKTNIPEQRKIKQGELERFLRDIQIHQRAIDESKLAVTELEQSKKSYAESINSITTEITKREQECLDLKNNRDETGQQMDLSALEEQIRSLERQIVEKNEVEHKLKSKVDDLRAQSCKMSSQLPRSKVTLNAKDKKAKISEIQEEIGKINQSLKEKIENLAEQRTTMLSDTNTLESIRRDVTDMVEELKTIDGKTKEQALKIKSLKNKVEILWNQKSDVEIAISQKRERLMRLQEDWKKSIGYNIYLGCKGVESVLKEFRDQESQHEGFRGYYGLVCDLMDHESHLDIAVEVTAKRRLAHHVVESREVAEKILKRFNEKGLPGVVNFIPSQREPRSSRKHTGLEKAVPLRSLIKFEAKFSPIMDFVFRDTLLCDSFEVATQLMKKNQVKCVTLEGEVVSSVGVITGGCRSQRPRLLELNRAKRRIEDEIIELEKDKDTLESQASTLTKEREALLAIHQKLRTQTAQTSQKKQQRVIDMKRLEAQISTNKGSIERNERNIDELRLKLVALDGDEKSLKTNKAITSEETGVKAMKEFRELMEKLRSLENEIQAQQVAKGTLDAELRTLSSRYYAALDKSQSQGMEVETEVARIQGDISSLKGQLERWQGKLEVGRTELQNLSMMMENKQTLLDALFEKKNAVLNEIQEIKNQLESYKSDITIWSNKRAEEILKGQALGILPTDHGRYEKYSDLQLNQKLKELNSKLKRSVSGGVNQQAIDQYERVKSKCDEYDQQLLKYANERNQINEFLSDLNAKKGEAVLHNIGLVQTEFKKIFCEIVPQGNAELVFFGPNLTLSSDWNPANVDVIEQVGNNAINSAKVNVNFVGKHLHQIRGLGQLSGGQKSVVALCIILAMQKIDPAPFYVFDEVDQALDPTYRGEVACQIQQLSASSQFICTTFRKELIHVAEKVFGVSCENSCSRIQQITKEQGINFVEEELPNSEAMDVDEDVETGDNVEDGDDAEPADGDYALSSPFA